MVGFVSLLLVFGLMDYSRPLFNLIATIRRGMDSAFFPHKRAGEWLKARVTYPRTGYVHAPLAFENATEPSVLLTAPA
jgi:hypothetical protein